MQEILTLKKCDHPNIVKIHDIFRDNKKLYIVMDFVEGKELLNYIIEQCKLKEAGACSVIKQLLKIIKYMHSKGIMHRDLKPENIMINPRNMQIKLVDFGLSSYFDEYKNLHTKVGTPYYVAPEVLDGNYNKEIDLWSIGVITYTLLTGCPPFQGENIIKIYERIRACKLKFYASDWEEISKESQDFIKKLVVKNPSGRMTADQALNHKWILMAEKLQSKITPDVIKKLARYKVPDILKKEVFLILANQIKDETIEDWNKTFEELDVEGTGMIRIDTLIQKCKDEGVNTNYLERLKRMNRSNADLKINYSDFLTKVIDINKEVNDFDIETAFKHFDAEGSGKITKESIIKFLKRKGDTSPEKNASIIFKQTHEKLKDTNKHENKDYDFSHYVEAASPKKEMGLSKFAIFGEI